MTVKAWAAYCRAGEPGNKMTGIGKLRKRKKQERSS